MSKNSHHLPFANEESVAHQLDMKRSEFAQLVDVGALKGTTSLLSKYSANWGIQYE
jgi:hypothetical protein